MNNTAHGPYKEWFSSGKLKVEAFVISGSADLTALAEKSWLFDGVCSVFDENGSLAACIYYNKGLLDGVSHYFHPNGSLWKKAPFVNGKLEGTYEVFLAEGQPFQKVHYKDGLEEGEALKFWPNGDRAAVETYSSGHLTNGCYFNKCGELVSKIDGGYGFKTLFSHDSIAEMHEYKNGFAEGEVRLFAKDGHLVALYHVKNGVKHGEEIEFYEVSISSSVNPKISIAWYEGAVQGVVKTWYENGSQESQKEMSQNKKNGLATAWYRDGSLMMIEEYELDHLKRGEYYKLGEKSPLSQVWNGNGIASLYDAEGNFLRKVTYLNGNPIE